MKWREAIITRVISCSSCFNLLIISNSQLLSTKQIKWHHSSEYNRQNTVKSTVQFPSYFALILHTALLNAVCLNLNFIILTTPCPMHSSTRVTLLLCDRSHVHHYMNWSDLFDATLNIYVYVLLCPFWILSHLCRFARPTHNTSIIISWLRYFARWLHFRRLHLHCFAFGVRETNYEASTSTLNHSVHIN